MKNDVLALAKHHDGVAKRLRGKAAEFEALGGTFAATASGISAMAACHEGFAADLRCLAAGEPAVGPDDAARAIADALNIELCPSCEEPLGTADRMEEPCASCQQDAGDRAYDAYRDREVA